MGIYSSFGLFPCLYSCRGHFITLHSRTSFICPQQQSKHFALIAFSGVLFAIFLSFQSLHTLAGVFYSVSMISVTSTLRALAILPIVSGLKCPPLMTLLNVHFEIPAAIKSFCPMHALAFASSYFCLLIFTLSPLFKYLCSVWNYL